MNKPDSSLDTYRAQIDALDERIVALLCERFGIVRAVGEWKARHGLPVVQSARAEQVKARVAALAAKQGLDGELLRDLYTRIIDHAHILETEIGKKMKESKPGDGE
ncbi:MAG: chorismate mutase [Rhodospirillales bacterium]|nr:chorismate mutase [Alphaproteobacteria bacterium]MCB9986410.1 chorismate mutase [Rhodospirillales bacterium]USO08614.1 MAG: chorismate mutase [Rhodospirillales bacterium]